MFVLKALCRWLLPEKGRGGLRLCFLSCWWAGGCDYCNDPQLHQLPLPPSATPTSQLLSQLSVSPLSLTRREVGGSLVTGQPSGRSLDLARLGPWAQWCPYGRAPVSGPGTPPVLSLACRHTFVQWLWEAVQTSPNPLTASSAVPG